MFDVRIFPRERSQMRGLRKRDKEEILSCIISLSSLLVYVFYNPDSFYMHFYPFRVYHCSIVWAI